MADASAYNQGFLEGYIYDPCNPPLDGRTREAYVEGYGDAMDVNLSLEGGRCNETVSTFDSINLVRPVSQVIDQSLNEHMAMLGKHLKS